MILRPGELLGLPAGVPGVVWDVAWWRDLLVLVAAAAGWSEARGRRGAALGFALAFSVLATAFWVAALARPYGVLVDPATTRWAADVSVAGAAGGGDGFLVGEPGGAGGWAWLARRIRTDLVLLVPSLLPVVLVPAAALVIALLWPHRDAPLAAMLWIGGGTGALDFLRGTGFVTGLWDRPGAGVLWVLTALAVLSLGRIRLPWAGSVAMGAAAVTCWAALGSRPPALGFVEALLALTADHHAWLLAGAAGLRRGRDRAACAFAAGGAALVVLAATGGAGDPWAGSTFLRLGLVLGATDWLARALPAPWPGPAPGNAVGVGGLAPVARRLGLVHLERLPAAGAVFLTLAGGLLTWWDPPRLDPVARESLEPVAEPLVRAMDWLRGQTDPGASVLAHADHAPAVAVLGGRRLLRAPGLLLAGDEERRMRLERAVLSGRAPPALVERYGLRYVFIAPGQFQEHGIVQPEDLEARGLRCLYADEKGLRVYEIVKEPDAAPPPPGGCPGPLK